MLILIPRLNGGVSGGPRISFSVAKQNALNGGYWEVWERTGAISMGTCTGDYL